MYRDEFGSGTCNCGVYVPTRRQCLRDLWSLIHKDNNCGNNWRQKGREYFSKSNPCDSCEERNLCDLVSAAYDKQRIIEGDLDMASEVLRVKSWYNKKDEKRRLSSVSHYSHVVKNGGLFALPMTNTEYLLGGYVGGLL